MIPLDAGCTGSSARWCPVCGDCACGPRYEGAGADGERTLDDDGCPLHGASSQHAREPARAVIPLDRVRELLAAATPGPWDAGAVNVYSTTACARHCIGGCPTASIPCACVIVTASASDRDRLLIAAAPDLAADLLDARQERDALAAALAAAEGTR